jgi:N-methylhydantoinase B
VIVSPVGEVDAAATEQARTRIRGEREEPPEFDFGPLPSIEKLGEQIAEERRTFDARLAGRPASA